MDAFRRPPDRRPTRHLYLANCGEARGDTRDSVLEALCALAPGLGVEEVHVGAGVSYVSLASAEEAERACAALRADGGRWVVRYAAREGEGAVPRGAALPGSVAATEHVEVPGLRVLPGFVSEEEAAELLAAVDARPWEASIRRRVQHYGHAFDYARLRLAEGGAEALPAFCTSLCERLASSGALPRPADQLTVNEYQPGVGIASHVDAHSAFEDGICALTLGAGIVMEFRRPQPDAGGKVSVGKHHRLAPPPSSAEQPEQKNVWLPANSLLVLTGEARYAWQHGIAWRKTDCLVEGRAVPRGRRVSFTFRTARHKPCDCQWPLMCDAQNPEAHVLPSRLGQAPEEPGFGGG